MHTLLPPETAITNEAIVVCFAICGFIISMVLIFLWILCFLCKLHVPRVDSIGLDDYIEQNVVTNVEPEKEEACPRQTLARVPTLSQSFLEQLVEVDGDVAENADVEEETDLSEMPTRVPAVPQFFLDQQGSSESEPDEEKNSKEKHC